ncbi:Calpain-1 catalytic subunit [Escovopsis weberi]|uniref:Calpain-1 catalytic subunit n=1 Tax=Escovopsis weberi TaxID=150374 RepID=A0A0M9VUE4_ESCWE|nr:Calpain-1 catalytic subunit [Escovopsis weberi]
MKASYDAAAAKCRHEVFAIAAECRRDNRKFRDSFFNIEVDLDLGTRDCLDSICVDSEGKPHGHDYVPSCAKRVTEIFDDPKFFINPPTAEDVVQGLGRDCWLIAAISSLTAIPGMIEKLCVASDAEVGVYGFVHFRDGEWVHTIVDDFLYLTNPDFDSVDELHQTSLLAISNPDGMDPRKWYAKQCQSNSPALYFAKCRNPQETWLPLLEKCFAKATGDYAALNGGFSGDAIEDMTGGITSEIYTSDILDKVGL